MHHIRGETFSLVFEPIVDMVSDKIVGYEGLCRCSDSNISSERFFKTLSVVEHFDLLTHQLQKYQKWVEQHPEIYRECTLFLNIDQNLLLEADFPTLFLPYCCYYNINLELEPRCPLSRAHCLAIKELVDFYGIPLWFDDYSGGMSPVLQDAWSGIKLDRYFFWSLTVNKKENFMLDNVIARNNVICEGVETNLEKKIALALGLRYGQGYLWPAVG
ncbi:EAL domain-containing protein [Aeromonas salmonicida]|uniref:EAL domain-containing protein n=1 Tax=Aeromonas salmonicida TaxID=645 RepID=UPI0038D3A33C